MANQTVTFSLVCLPTLWLLDGLIPEFLDYPLELLVLDIERLETYPYLLFGLGLPLLSGLGLFLSALLGEPIGLSSRIDCDWCTEMF